jgi:uncharacterized protein YybS (DUF2232 family)
LVESIPPKNLLVPTVLVFILFFVLIVFSPLGALIGVLSPFPLVFIYLQRGRQIGIVLVALVFVVLLLLVGANQAMLFLSEYALMALVLGELIRFQLPGDRCIAISALVSGFVSMVLLVALFEDHDVSVKEFFAKQVHSHFSQSIEAFEAIGDSKAEVEEIKAFAEKAAEGFAASYPAFLLIGSLIGAAANYALIQITWMRLYGPGLFARRAFSEWVCPENLVWGFIFSGAALFLGQGIVADAGLNVLLIMLCIYFAQGFSIIVHFLKVRKVPTFFWFVLFILIFVQPLLIGLVAGLGVFDIWADFRKLKTVEDVS